MKNYKNKLKKAGFLFLIYLFFFINSVLNVVYAVCPENVVPNPLDPNCDRQGDSITVGFLINRFIVFLPYIVTIIAVGAFIWGSIIVITAQNGEARKAGIQIWINAALGLSLFFSIWLVLFLISMITGVDLLKAIGQ